MGGTNPGRLSLHGISTFQDGPWFTVYLPGDPLDTGSHYSQWPDRLREANLPRRSGIPSAGSTPPRSSGRRDSVTETGGAHHRGPGVINLDVSLRRVLQVRDEETLEVRLEAFTASTAPTSTPGPGPGSPSSAPPNSESSAEPSPAANFNWPSSTRSRRGDFLSPVLQHRIANGTWSATDSIYYFFFRDFAGLRSWGSC